MINNLNSVKLKESPGSKKKHFQSRLQVTLWSFLFKRLIIENYLLSNLLKNSGNKNFNGSHFVSFFLKRKKYEFMDSFYGNLFALSSFCSIV